MKKLIILVSIFAVFANSGSMMNAYAAAQQTVKTKSDYGVLVRFYYRQVFKVGENGSCPVLYSSFDEETDTPKDKLELEKLNDAFCVIKGEKGLVPLDRDKEFAPESFKGTGNKEQDLEKVKERIAEKGEKVSVEKTIQVNNSPVTFTMDFYFDKNDAIVPGGIVAPEECEGRQIYKVLYTGGGTFATSSTRREIETSRP